MIYYIEGTVYRSGQDDAVCERLGLTKQELADRCCINAPHLFARSKAELRRKVRNRLEEVAPTLDGIEALVNLGTLVPASYPLPDTDLRSLTRASYEDDFDAIALRFSSLRRAVMSGAMENQKRQMRAAAVKLQKEGFKVTSAGEERAVIAKALLEEFLKRFGATKVHRDELIDRFAAIIGGLVKVPSVSSVKMELKMTKQKEIAKALGKSKNLGGWRTKRLIAKGKMEPKSPRVVFDGWE